MADRENHNLPPVEMIESDVGAAPELNDPLAELGHHSLHGSANLRMRAERFHALSYRGDRAAGGIGIL